MHHSMLVTSSIIIAHSNWVRSEKNWSISVWSWSIIFHTNFDRITRDMYSVRDQLYYWINIYSKFFIFQLIFYDIIDHFNSFNIIRNFRISLSYQWDIFYDIFGIFITGMCPICFQTSDWMSFSFKLFSYRLMGHLSSSSGHFFLHLCDIWGNES